LREKLTESLDWSRIRRPFSVRRPGVERIADIPFARASGIDLLLDVYRPSDESRDCPVLLQIHGGAWTDTRLDKSTQALPLMFQLAANGWACVSADYRLSPGATHPDHIIDVKKAIQWIRQNGERYGMNGDFIVITGGSAGGHLSALAAVTANDLEVQPGFEEIDTSVYACVPFYGVYDLIDERGQAPNDALSKLLETSVMKGRVDEKPKDYLAASPLHRVSHAAPPFFALHGDCDTLVPPRHALDFVERLRATSREHAALAVLPGGQHGFDSFGSPRGQHAVNGVERYLCWIYSRYLADRAQALASPVAEQ
jgi:acetyl esterase/lipase